MPGGGAFPRRTDHQGPHGLRRWWPTGAVPHRAWPEPRHAAVPALLEGQRPQAVLADRAYDAYTLRQHLERIGAAAVIPSTRPRKAHVPHDPEIYKLRNRIERCFNKLRHFRRFATRNDRLATHYLAFIHLATSMLWMRW